jgi:hypothetical protein
VRLPTQKKILREDLKDAPPYVNGIIEPVNTFMEATYQALNKNITFQENIASFIKELTYTTPSTYPAGVENVSFQNTLRTRPIGVQLMQIYDKSTYTPPAGPVFIPWIEDDGTIIIYPLTGLAASKSYLLRLVII